MLQTSHNMCSRSSRQSDTADILPNSVSTNSFFSIPSQGDPTQQFHCDNFVPNLESPTSATLFPYQSPPGVMESTMIYAQDLLGRSPPVSQREPAVHSAAQAQLDKHDDGVIASVPHQPQLHAYALDYPDCEFDQPTSGEQSMVKPQTMAALVTTDTTAALPSASSNMFSTSGQVSYAVSTNLNFSAAGAFSGTSSNTSKPELVADSCQRQFTFDLDNSDGAFDLVPQTTLTPFMANEPTPALADNRHALHCPHPSCASKPVFLRQCDLNQHYRSHVREFPCRVPDCRPSNRKRPMFALRKDRDRHESSHRPSLPCRHCGRLFSRRDNLRDHCRSQHQDPI